VPAPSLAIVVLGGSRGIGRAIVACAVAEGHRVFAGARGELDLAALSRALTGPRGTLRTAAVDLGDDASVRAFYAAARAALGEIDVVVNNAAVEGYGRLAEMSPEAIEAIVRTNLLGMLFSCRHAALAMTPGGGHIINIGSEVAYRAVPLKSVYTATKFAVRGLSDALALELAPSGIRVSQVHPGWVDTGLHDDERRRTGRVSRPRSAATPAAVADQVASLWRRGEPRQVASMRARLRGAIGDVFPAWARWRTRRAFSRDLEDA
jgi:NAD(P)-dependent dehydrogenase (short-subunit alcohol dehydrogenase family)